MAKISARLKQCRCLSCGNEFPETSIAVALDDWDRWEGVCPECGSDDIDDVYMCRGCDRYFLERDLTADYCRDCAADIIKFFNDLLDNNFTEEERELLNEAYDGRNF